MRIAPCRMGTLLALSLALACGDDENGPGSFSLSYCSPGAPAWVAQQDGDGAWQRVLPSSGNTYDFNFTTGRGGIAAVIGGDPSSLWIQFATTGELASYAAYINRFGGCPSKTVSGTVAGVPEPTVAVVSLGSAAAMVPTGETTFQLEFVPNGSLPLVATRRPDNTAPFVVDRIIMRSDVNVANGGSINPVLDFESAEAFGPATASATVTSLEPTDQAVLWSGFVGTGSDHALFSFQNVTAAANQVEYAALPASRLAATEWQMLFLGVDGPSTRGAQLFYRALVSHRSFGAGPLLATPTITPAATTPVLRPRVQLPRQAEYDRVLHASFWQAPSRSVGVWVTAAYLGNQSEWDITVPDLSGAAGWNNAWGLDPAQEFDTEVMGTGGTVLMFGDQLREGAMTLTATYYSNPDPFPFARAPLDPRLSTERALARR